MEPHSMPYTVNNPGTLKSCFRRFDQPTKRPEKESEVTYRRSGHTLAATESLQLIEGVRSLDSWIQNTIIRLPRLPTIEHL